MLKRLDPENMESTGVNAIAGAIMIMILANADWDAINETSRPT